MLGVLVIGFASLFLLSGCGNSSTTATAASTVCSTGYTYSTTYGSCLYTGTTTSTTCSSGYVYSSTYGTCLQQTTACEGNYALYNGSCVLYSGTTTTTTSYQGSCSTGYIQTADGCLTQGACTTGYGYGYYYGQPWCFPATY